MANETQPPEEHEVLSPEEIDMLFKAVARSDLVSKLDKSLFKGKDLELVSRIINYFHQNKIDARLINKIESDAREENYRNYKTIDLLINQKIKSPLLGLGIGTEYPLSDRIQIRKDKTIVNLFFDTPDSSSRFPKYSDDISLEDIFNPKSQDLKDNIDEAIHSFLNKRTYGFMDELPIKSIEIGYSKTTNSVTLHNRVDSDLPIEIAIPAMEILGGEIQGELFAQGLKDYLEKGPKNTRLTLWTTPDNINIIGTGKTDGSNNYSSLMLYSFQTPVDKIKSLLEKVIMDSERKYYERLHKPHRRSL
jgi:hypothetical protein